MDFTNEYDVIGGSEDKAMDIDYDPFCEDFSDATYEVVNIDRYGDMDMSCNGAMVNRDEWALLQSLARFGDIGVNGHYVGKGFDHRIDVKCMSLFDNYKVTYWASVGPIKVSHCKEDVLNKLKEKHKLVHYCPLLSLGSHKYILYGDDTIGKKVIPINVFCEDGAYVIAGDVYIPADFDDEVLIRDQELTVYLYDERKEFIKQAPEWVLEDNDDLDVWDDFVVEPRWQKNIECAIVPSLRIGGGRQFEYIARNYDLRERFLEYIRKLQPFRELEQIKKVSSILASIGLKRDVVVLSELNSLIPKSSPYTIEGERLRAESQALGIAEAFGWNWPYVVEIGGGKGNLLQALSMEGLGTKRMVNVEVQGVSTWCDTVEVVQGQPLPMKDGEVDIVILSMSLHHVHFQKKMIQECYRILRPGGSLYLREHNCKTNRDRVLYDTIHLMCEVVCRKKNYFDFVKSYHARYRKKSEWDDKFERHGFTNDGDEPEKGPLNVVEMYYSKPYNIPLNCDTLVFSGGDIT